MQLPTVNISSIHGKIGLQTDRPYIQIKQHDPNFSIKQEHAALQIRKQPAKLSIDQSQAFASANLKHIFQLNKEWAAKGLQSASQATAKYAREGDMMKKIESGSNPIPHLARENSVLYPERQITLTQMPAHNTVKMHFQPSQLNIHVQSGAANIHVDRREPTIEHRPWQTSAYIRQKNSIDFQVVGGQINRGL